MRSLILLLIFIFIITMLVLLCNTVHAEEKITIVVSAPIEKYILSQLLGNITVIKSILSGEYEPHLQLLTRKMISMVLKSDLYVPLYHFEFEYRLIKICEQHSIPIVRVNMHRLILLRFPHTKIINTHGWWLLPENALYLANCTLQVIKLRFPELANYLQGRYEQFRQDIHRLSIILRRLGEKARYLKNMNNALLVCAAPVQYLLESLNLTCDVVISEKGLSSSQILLIEKHRGPVIALLANFQRDSAVDRALSDIVKRKGGTILYIPVIGLRNYNMSYTSFMLLYSGEILGALSSAKFSVATIKKKSAYTYGDVLLYVCLLLAALLAISLIINISLLRRA